MAKQVDRALMDAYYRQENTRPLVGFFVGPYYPLHLYRGAATLPDGLYGPEDLEIAAYLPDDERLFGQHAACPGDLVWAASAFWGVPWMEAALGCAIEADHQTGSSRSHPITTSGWPELPPFAPENPWVARCIAMIGAIAEQAQGRYPLAVSLMRGVSDCLSAVLGFDRMIYTMLDEPARIHALAERITAFWIAFGQAQLDAMPRFQGGYGSFEYSLWAPDRCIWLQEDAAALLSPDLFREFILPYDREIARAFPYCFMHLHPGRYIPHAPLLDTDLAVIELHIDQGGPSARELLDVYQMILGNKPLFVWGDISEEDLQVLLKKLPPEGVGLQIAVDSVERAHDLYRRYVE